MTSTEQSRRKYDQLADRYEEMFFYVADVGRRLVDYADPAPGTRVLDVGAGRGAVARAALARGCQVTAVDASARMVQLLAADHPEITARQQDAGRLDFADGSFDLVTSGFVLQVLDEPGAAVAEAFRVLAPGGTVAVSVERQSVGRLAWLHELNAGFFGAGRAAREPLTDATVVTLLTEAGFTGPQRLPVEMPLPLAGPQALWDWLASQGVGAALRAMPAARAADFRERFFAGARRMHDEGGIALEFAATLHRARR